MRYLLLALLLCFSPLRAWDGFADAPEKGLIADYDFSRKSKTKLYDKSPYANHASMVAITWTADGFVTYRGRKAFKFAKDGARPQVFLGNIDSTTSITVICAFSMADTGATSRSLWTLKQSGQGPTAANYSAIGAYDKTANIIQVASRNPAFSVTTTSNANADIFNSRYMEAVRSGIVQRIFVGGRQTDADTAVAAGRAAIDSLIIGNLLPGSSSQSFSGWISELKIYKGTGRKTARKESFNLWRDRAKKSGFGATWKGFE